MSRASALVWRREGLVRGVQPGRGWWRSHAQMPTVLAINERLWRIFFCARDEHNRSMIVAVDVDPGNGMAVVADHAEPLLQLGGPGSFDHSGMAVSCVMRVGDHVRLYYTGVAQRRDVPAQTAIGVAVSSDGLHFEKAFAGPVLSTGPRDPLFVLSGHVLARSGGYRAWYVSGTQWVQAGEVLDMLYEIRTTASADGLFWNTTTATAASVGTDEALGRPFVLDTAGGPHLWYCRRGTDFRGPGAGAYRLLTMSLDAGGCAAAPPGPVLFENPPGVGDFDSWMQCYPCVVPLEDELIMFYNGNDFGRAGFGWARCPGGAKECL